MHVVTPERDFHVSFETPLVRLSAVARRSSLFSRPPTALAHSLRQEQLLWTGDLQNTLEHAARAAQLHRKRQHSKREKMKESIFGQLGALYPRGAEGHPARLKAKPLVAVRASCRRQSGW
jgi:hypothetical protein